MSWFEKKKQVQTVAVLTVPERQGALKSLMTATETEEYEKTAEEIGFYPPALIEAKLVNFLNENNIHTYDYKKVHEFLIQKFRNGWRWTPLRVKDAVCASNIRYRNGSDYGGFGYGTYNAPIPHPVLLTIQKIEEAFKDQIFFFVSEEGGVRPPDGDPFLLATGIGIRNFVVERWNEPSFRE